MAAPPVDDARLRRRRRRRPVKRGVVAEERGPEAARRRVEGPERPRAAPGPASSARCQPSERPRGRVSTTGRAGPPSPVQTSRSRADAGQRRAKTMGEGGGARGLVREPKDDAGDGVAIGGAGGGCDWSFSVAFLNVFSGDGKPTDPAPAGLAGALNENNASAVVAESLPNKAETSQRDRLGDGVLSPSE